MSSVVPASEKLILIVDDDADVCALLKEVVAFQGFQVQVARNGDEAVEKISQRRPDLLLLDLMLPPAGGFDILHRLQTSHAKVPVIIMTARYTDETTAALLKQEPDVIEFFEKPINLDALGERLHKALKTRRPEAR